MSSANDVPEKVQTHLLPNEKVIGRFSSIWREYYATDKRLIGFQRPDWVVWLLILGILPGVLGIILTRKVYMGALKYSTISGIKRVLLNQVVLVVLAIVIGAPLAIWGIVALATYEDPGGGLLLLILGVFAFTVLWLSRPSLYQLKIAGLPEAEGRKWVFSKSKGLKHKNSADKFAELIKSKIKA